MDLGLTGRTAVVTGASRGIGLAITRGLAAHGAHVVAGARKSSPELDQLAKDGSVQVLEVDLADPEGPAWPATAPPTSRAPTSGSTAA
jgi:NAD(P)-dependent dehydrogenase (short-subunit alcohol dehydrogenase family)